MLTPLDKVQSGANDIIQVVITTACSLHTCSNCTQLLPFRRDYQHMRLSVVEEALESLRDWPGVVALFGGNPCSHPHFPVICEMLARIVPDQRRRGLWSNDLLGHADVARRTFYPHGRFNLNVHGNLRAAEKMALAVPGKVIPQSLTTPAVHSGILVHWEDLGLDYPTWEGLREQCDINQHWSAAIMERDGQPYAYFCEVAGALDGIRQENHGLRVYPDWWRAPMAIYMNRGQVQQCCDRGCGVPLRIRGHKDLDDTYDVSKAFETLTLHPRGKVTVKPFEGDIQTAPEATDYMKVRS